MWEPIWQAVDEVGLPLHFHTFPAPQFDRLQGLDRPAKRAAMFTVVTNFQIQFIDMIAAIVGSAVLERYSGVRMAGLLARRPPKSTCRVMSASGHKRTFTVALEHVRS